MRELRMLIFLVHFLMILSCVVQNGNAAASLSVAEQYVSAFSNLAKESNTILLPSNTGDISGMVTQVRLHALFVFMFPFMELFLD